MGRVEPFYASERDEETNMKAWVIRWDWAGDHAAHPNPFIAVLSARCGSESVREFVERFYITATASVSEQIEYARYTNPRPPAYTANVSAKGLIDCGHNPFIVARRAEDVRLTDLDVLQWTENGRERSLNLHSAMPTSSPHSSSESS